MASVPDQLELRVVSNNVDLRGAQRLRYSVFVEELGGTGAKSDHDARLECDEFDAYCDHLILVDPNRDPAGLDHVLGVYRLMRIDQMRHAGRFYSEDEYDLSRLKTSGKKLLELGRSCVRADARGGNAVYQLWRGLADYVTAHEIDVLFGVASFHGTQVSTHAAALSYLHQNHLAEPDLRARSKTYQPMNLISPEQIDRPAVVRTIPPLIKSYLRLGGMVGDGAYIDHDFNTIDVCLVMDTARLTAQQRAIYSRKSSA